MDSHHVTSPIRVLLVDDHPGVRQGLALLLAPEGIEACAEAGGKAQAMEYVGKCRFELAIIDLSLDGEDGLTLVAELHQRSVPVLVYSMHKDAQHVGEAFAAGALGYVTKREHHAVLVQAIRDVAAGRLFVSPQAAGALAERLTGMTADDSVQKLSPHERRVYELIGRGEDIFDIAAALRISHHTVETYYGRILVKLNLNGMHELRRHAIDYLQKHGR
jgi:DNA-binding NarL/FixJ family response regulator